MRYPITHDGSALVLYLRIATPDSHEHATGLPAGAGARPRMFGARLERGAPAFWAVADDETAPWPAWCWRCATELVLNSCNVATSGPPVLDPVVADG